MSDEMTSGLGLASLRYEGMVICPRCIDDVILCDECKKGRPTAEEVRARQAANPYKPIDLEDENERLKVDSQRLDWLIKTGYHLAKNPFNSRYSIWGSGAYSERKVHDEDDFATAREAIDSVMGQAE